jgi:hypothetical protein
MKWFLSCLIILPLLTACRLIPISGAVVNESGDPVAGAHVTLTRTGREVITGRDGTFGFSQTRTNDTLTVTAPGYEPVAETNNERGLMRIILHRAVAGARERTAKPPIRNFQIQDSGFGRL